MIVSPVIEYASERTSERLDARCAAAAAPLLWMAIGSGLCVAVCFVTLASGGQAWWLHLLVFAGTLTAAGVAGARLGSLNETPRTMMDLAASIGLVGLAVAPLVMLSIRDVSNEGTGALAFCYLLMAGSTVRHIWLYRMLADHVRVCGQKTLAKMLVGLGWTKTIYEAIWLACCAGALLALSVETPGMNDTVVNLAFGALIGCGLFGAVWIWMLVAHGMLLRLARRRTEPALERGFAIEVPTSRG